MGRMEFPIYSANDCLAVRGTLDFAIIAEGVPLFISWITNAKSKCDSIGCAIGNKTMRLRYRNYGTKGYKYKYTCCKEIMGRGYFYRGISIAEQLIKKSYLITDNEHLNDDFYNYLMNNYKLPLLKEWTGYIKEQLTWREFERECSPIEGQPEMNREIKIGVRNIKLANLVVYRVNLPSERLEEIVSNGLSSGAIKLGNKKNTKSLEFEGFNDYVQNYGKTLVENLKEYVHPLMELKPSVDSLALYGKKLYPQQAAAVNGVINAIDKGLKFTFLNEGMGVGKTIQAASIVDGYFNMKYMREHKASLKDTLLSGEVKYRNAILCPGHLVKKWAEEIESEVPGSKAIIVKDFSQFVALRAAGKERTGKEFYIMSKDFAKLGSLVEPIPTKVVRNHVANVKACSNCLETNHLVIKKNYSQKACPDCNGRVWENRPLPGLHYGLICPDCGELLITSPNAADAEEVAEKVLTPKNFASKTSSNSYCYHCGASLWGVSAKNIDCGGEFAHLAERKPKWYKMKHWKAYNKKSTVNSFVLKGWEDDYLNSVVTPDGWVEKTPFEKGPRKTAPSQYIKKYLKGYFDILILDECHKFQGGAGSAQAIAAHALMKCSKFTLGLTGTLLNGKASSIFYLLWMLCPEKMVAEGFEYSSCMEFSKRYGAVETIHESNGDESYNKSSRGKQVTQPREKPGISPLVYTNFLMDRAISLDLSDLSSYLPPLYENVELVEMEEDLKVAYDRDVNIFKDALRKPEGKKMMSGLLNFGLSYPDKPWGRLPIMSATLEDVVVLNPENLSHLVEGNHLLHKEQRLVDIVNKEIGEGRNCFVYCSYTGEKETNITQRLKEVIEKHCNLKGMVQIIESNSPKAEAREEWMHEKAAEGYRVFICNPKVVETGLDFCFRHKDKSYNFPTLIFYQMSYELAVLWQASRRAYRLSQTVECRNYYLAYAGTLQAVAVQLMAEKQMATSAIQGKLSAEGLASMANGVDARVKMAQALAEGDNGDIEDISTMFDVLNRQNNAESETLEITSKTFFEVTGQTKLEVVGKAEENTIDIFANLTTEEPKVKKAEEKVEKKPEPALVDMTDLSVGSQLDLFASLFGNVDKAVVNKPKAKKTAKKSVVKFDAQVALFDFAF